MAENTSWGVRVLLAEDSPTVRHFLTNLINETPGFRVIGVARDGEEAIAMVQELKPDVVSMDVRMPRMDGLEATRRIMTVAPTPVVVVSGLLESEMDLSFQALQAGALAVIEKPPDRRDPRFPEKRQMMMKTLLAMSSVKVIQRRELSPQRMNSITVPLVSAPAMPVAKSRVIENVRPAPEIIAIGASAGGPSAMITLLNGLPANIGVPIVIVQHIPNEFINGLARWLQKSTPFSMMVPSHDVPLKPDTVYLASGTSHMTVTRLSQGLGVHLVKERGTHRYQPSVDVLFNSIATTCGSKGLGIILTGMGDDGAEGLLAMRRAGARTFAQDEASSIVFGMPGAAIERGGVEQVLSLPMLATAIRNLM